MKYKISKKEYDGGYSPYLLQIYDKENNIDTQRHIFASYNPATNSNRYIFNLYYNQLCDEEDIATYLMSNGVCEIHERYDTHETYCMKLTSLALLQLI